MRRISPLHLAIACTMFATLTGCAPKEHTETETATSGSDSATIGASTENAGPIVVTTTSDEARTLYTRGRVLADQLRIHDARKLFEQAVAKDSSFALAQYDLALSSPTTREFLEHLNRAVALSSTASDGERLMILALQSGVNGDSKQSLEYTEELAAKYPHDARAQTLLAVGYSGAQQYDKAVARLTKATSDNPGYAPAYNVLGYSYMPQRKYTEAEQAFKKYIELVPNDPNPYDSYAEMLMRTGRFDESIAQYRKALSIEPHFSNSYIGIATDLMFQGKHDAAAAEAQKLFDAARDDGDRRLAIQSRAVTFVDQGKTAKALQELDKLYALDARIGDTTAMSGDAGQMGDLLLGVGQADEAGKRYHQALTLIQSSSVSKDLKDVATLADRYNVARVALARNDLPAAKAAAEEYQSGAEATHDAGRIRLGHELAGTIALQEKDFDTAITHLAQADQQDPFVLYTMAVAYQGKGDAVKAKELARQSTELRTFPTIRSSLVRAKAIKMM